MNTSRMRSQWSVILPSVLLSTIQQWKYTVQKKLETWFFHELMIRRQTDAIRSLTRNYHFDSWWEFAITHDRYYVQMALLKRNLSCWQILFPIKQSTHRQEQDPKQRACKVCMVKGQNRWGMKYFNSTCAEKPHLHPRECFTKYDMHVYKYANCIGQIFMCLCFVCSYMPLHFVHKLWNKVWTCLSIINERIKFERVFERVCSAS